LNSVVTPGFHSHLYLAVTFILPANNVLSPIEPEAWNTSGPLDLSGARTVTSSLMRLFRHDFLIPNDIHISSKARSSNMAAGNTATALAVYSTHDYCVTACNNIFMSASSFV
jgi:hypothetical protein